MRFGYLLHFLIVLTAFGTKAIRCIVITDPPTNTSVILGNDVTLHCSVLYQEDGSHVLWKRLKYGSEVLTLNNRSTHAAKYDIDGTYDLVIQDTALDDEGEYECDTGDQQVRVFLTVLVLMRNMTVSWGLPVPFDVGKPVNMTCIATNSRPAASLRWFRGSHDITNLATSFQTTTRADGYGDAVSTIGSAVVSEDVPFRCVADLPGHPAARTEFLFPPVTNSANVISLNLAENKDEKAGPNVYNYSFSG